MQAIPAYGTEYILVFSKDKFHRQENGISTTSRDEFLSYTTSIWEIPSESPRRVQHPAPFPVALLERLIRLYTFEQDVVLDPLMGSGTTAVAAKKNSRHFVGYETCAEYARIGEQQLRDLRFPTSMKGKDTQLE